MSGGEPIVDHLAAQSAFISVAFGLNTLFAFYKSFRLKIEEFAKKTFAECVGRAKAIESNKAARRLDMLTNHIQEVSVRHSGIQEWLLSVAILLSILSAILCLLVLYFDWIKDIGKLNVILILSFPVYCFISSCNLGWFYIYCNRKIGRYEKFIKEFELAPDNDIEAAPLDSE